MSNNEREAHALMALEAQRSGEMVQPMTNTRAVLDAEDSEVRVKSKHRVTLRYIESLLTYTESMPLVPDTQTNTLVVKAVGLNFNQLITQDQSTRPAYVMVLPKRDGQGIFAHGTQWTDPAGVKRIVPGARIQPSRELFDKFTHCRLTSFQLRVQSSTVPINVGTISGEIHTCVGSDIKDFTDITNQATWLSHILVEKDHDLNTTARKGVMVCGGPDVLKFDVSNPASIGFSHSGNSLELQETTAAATVAAGSFHIVGTWTVGVVAGTNRHELPPDVIDRGVIVEVSTRGTKASAAGFVLVQVVVQTRSCQPWMVSTPHTTTVARRVYVNQASGTSTAENFGARIEVSRRTLFEDIPGNSGDTVTNHYMVTSITVQIQNVSQTGNPALSLDSQLTVIQIPGYYDIGGSGPVYLIKMENMAQGQTAQYTGRYTVEAVPSSTTVADVKAGHESVRISKPKAITQAMAVFNDPDTKIRRVYKAGEHDQILQELPFLVTPESLAVYDDINLKKYLRKGLKSMGKIFGIARSAAPILDMVKPGLGTAVGTGAGLGQHASAVGLNLFGNCGAMNGAMNQWQMMRSAFDGNSMPPRINMMTADDSFHELPDEIYENPGFIDDMTPEQALGVIQSTMKRYHVEDPQQGKTYQNAGTDSYVMKLNPHLSLKMAETYKNLGTNTSIRNTKVRGTDRFTPPLDMDQPYSTVQGLYNEVTQNDYCAKRIMGLPPETPSISPGYVGHSYFPGVRMEGGVEKSTISPMVCSNFPVGTIDAYGKDTPLVRPAYVAVHIDVTLGSGEQTVRSIYIDEKMSEDAQALDGIVNAWVAAGAPHKIYISTPSDIRSSGNSSELAAFACIRQWPDICYTGAIRIKRYPMVSELIPVGAVLGKAAAAAISDMPLIACPDAQTTALIEKQNVLSEAVAYAPRDILLGGVIKQTKLYLAYDTSEALLAACCATYGKSSVVRQSRIRLGHASADEMEQAAKQAEAQEKARTEKEFYEKMTPNQLRNAKVNITIGTVEHKGIPVFDIGYWRDNFGSVLGKVEPGTEAAKKLTGFDLQNVQDKIDAKNVKSLKGMWQQAYGKSSKGSGAGSAPQKPGSKAGQELFDYLKSQGFEISPLQKVQRPAKGKRKKKVDQTGDTEAMDQDPGLEPGPILWGEPQSTTSSFVPPPTPGPPAPKKTRGWLPWSPW